MIRIFLSIAAIFLLISCRTTRLPSDATVDNMEVPAGTIRIAHNLYVDKTEIRNIDYLEFMAWVEKLYGETSTEYKSILPDSTVWSKLKGNYISLDTFYLRHPAYRDYPVVGISYEQAVTFSKWRSDRVMEFFLIREGVIPFNPLISKDSAFTTEKYFAGQYHGITPNPHLLIYPFYSLPDSATYYRTSVFADSLNYKNYPSCKKKFCADKLLIGCNCLDQKQNITSIHPYGSEPTMQANCGFCKKELITHLKGNVREMTLTKGAFYGSCFYDSCKVSNNICRRDTNFVNSYTGFRNVCTYKQWK